MQPNQLIQNYLKQTIVIKSNPNIVFNTFYIIKIIDLTKYMPIENLDILLKKDFLLNILTNKHHEKFFEKWLN